jgi:hypothetical protein
MKLLRRAERSQSYYHHCQQRRIKAGKTTRGCSHLAMLYAKKLARED